MAAAFRSAAAAVESAGAVTSLALNSYTLTAGDLLCALIAVNAESNPPTSVVSDVDGAMELVLFNARPGGRAAGLYVIENATAGGHVCTITYPGNENLAGLAFGMSGVDMAQSWDGTAEAEADTSTALDLSVTSPAGDLALLVGATANQVALSMNNGTAHVDTATSNFGLFVCSRAGVGTTQIDGTLGASEYWTAIGANINAASSIGGPVLRGGRALRGLTQGRVAMYHNHPTISLEAYRREQARKHREFMAKVAA